MKAKRELITIIGIILIAMCLLMSIPGHADTCIVNNTGSQVLTVSTWNIINFNNEIYDPYNLHNPADNSKITIQKAGNYSIVANLYLNATSAADFNLYKNGVTIGYVLTTPPSYGYAAQTISAITHCNQSDVITVAIYTYQSNRWSLNSPTTPLLSVSEIDNQTGSLGGGEMTTDQFGAIMAFMIIIAGFCGIMGIKHIYFWIRGENG